jgi:Flp pilus assembly protein TadG
MAIKCLFDLLRHHLQHLRSAESGNVLVTFTLLLVPLMGAVGAAVDFSVANKARTELQAAADAGAVGSVAKSSPAMAAAQTMSEDGPIAAGVTDALNIFNAQLAGRTGFTNAVPSAAVTRTNGSVNATVSFNANVPMKFMGIFGMTSITVTGTSKASNGLPTYIDFYLLLDNTPSMGVGATPADVATMVNNTPDQCAFACHDLSAAPNDYYTKAKLLGVKMRIDVVRSATQQLMDTAKAIALNPNQFRAAIYDFGTSASLGLTTVAPLSANLTSAKTLAANIDLMTVPYQNYNNDMDTDFNDVLTDMNSAISTPGSGTGSNSPQKVLFFVSDGVGDSHNPSTCSRPLASGGRCQAPIDVSYCTTIKNRGIKIAVLYTTYLPLPTNAWYNSWIAPFVSQIGTNMQNCASPGFYFEVSPTQGISDAMNALFKKVVAEAHLTQ